MGNLINLFYRVRWWFLVITNQYTKNNGYNSNFTLIKEWDFSHSDFKLLNKDFRYTPPWGEKVNKNCSSKLNKRGIQFTEEGIVFNNILNPDNDKVGTPFIAGALVSKPTNLLPKFGKVSAMYAIERTEGNWCSFWITDEKNTMPEFDIIEFFGLRNGRRKLTPNIHYGTSYTSKNYKFQHPINIYFPKKLGGKFMEWSAEFYPNKTLYKINNTPIYLSNQSCSTNDKVVWLSGGTWYLAVSDNVGKSSSAQWLRYYKLKDEQKTTT